jgi:serine/threonine protein kinase
MQVSDFGLAQVQPSSSSLSSCYSTGMPTTVPVRWSPPEVLTQYQWSEKSDVWSFGVTAWEIFNYGNEPYANMSDDEVQQTIQISATYLQLYSPGMCKFYFLQVKNMDLLHNIIKIYHSSSLQCLIK